MTKDQLKLRLIIYFGFQIAFTILALVIPKGFVGYLMDVGWIFFGGLMFYTAYTNPTDKPKDKDKGIYV